MLPLMLRQHFLDNHELHNLYASLVHQTVPPPSASASSSSSTASSASSAPAAAAASPPPPALARAAASPPASSNSTPPLPPLVPPPYDLSKPAAPSAAAAAAVLPASRTYASQSQPALNQHVLSSAAALSYESAQRALLSSPPPLYAACAASSTSQPSAQAQLQRMTQPPTYSQPQPQPHAQPQVQRHAQPLPQPQPQLLIHQQPAQPAASSAASSSAGSSSSSTSSSSSSSSSGRVSGPVLSFALPYPVTRQILQPWPETLHQYERDSGFCFDLLHFATLLTATNYSAASDYLVAFWTHPLYRNTLSREDHNRVRHALVSIMELKLTLLSMTTDRLTIEYFIEKEFKPKLLALSLRPRDVEDLIRKAYCNVRVRFPCQVQALRHTVWYELTRAAEPREQPPQSSGEERLIALFMREQEIANAHRQLAVDVRALPFHFATIAPHSGSEAAGRQAAPDRRDAGSVERQAARRDEEKEVKEESVSAEPAAPVAPSPTSQQLTDEQRRERRRKRHDRDERRERDGTSERRKRPALAGANASREVIELSSDSNRTDTDDEKQYRQDEQRNSDKHRDDGSHIASMLAAMSSVHASQSPPAPHSNEQPALPLPSSSASSAVSSPSEADLQPLSSLIDRESDDVYMPAPQVGEDDDEYAHSAARMVEEGFGEHKAAYEPASSPTPPAASASVVSEPLLPPVRVEEAKEPQPPARGELSGEPDVAMDGALRVHQHIERQGEMEPTTEAVSPVSAPLLPRALELGSPIRQLSDTAPPVASSAFAPAPSTAPPTAESTSASSSRSPSEKWPCATCTFLNVSARTLCEACRAPRSQSASSASPLPTQSLFTSSSSSSAASAPSSLALSGLPPPVPPVWLGMPLPPRNVPRTKQTARKSTGAHSRAYASPPADGQARSDPAASSGTNGRMHHV